MFKRQIFLKIKIFHFENYAEACTKTNYRKGISIFASTSKLIRTSSNIRSKFNRRKGFFWLMGMRVSPYALVLPPYYVHSCYGLGRIEIGCECHIYENYLRSLG